MKNREKKIRLLLDFMGEKPGYNSFTGKYGWSNSPWFACSYDTEEEVMDAVAEYAKYDRDWNRLMKIVEEIGLGELETTNRNCMGIVSMYGLNRTVIQCYKNENLLHTIDRSDIAGLQPTFEACVEYVEWYNQNK